MLLRIKWSFRCWKCINQKQHRKSRGTRALSPQLNWARAMEESVTNGRNGSQSQNSQVHVRRERYRLLCLPYYAPHFQYDVFHYGLLTTSASLLRDHPSHVVWWLDPLLRPGGKNLKNEVVYLSFQSSLKPSRQEGIMEQHLYTRHISFKKWKMEKWRGWWLGWRVTAQHLCGNSVPPLGRKTSKSNTCLRLEHKPPLWTICKDNSLGEKKRPDKLFICVSSSSNTWMVIWGICILLGG